MSLASVLSNITFWSTGAWSTSPSLGVGTLTSGEQANIISAITNLYNSSTYAAALLDSGTAVGPYYIGKSTNGDAGAATHGLPYDNYMVLNEASSDQVYYMNDYGTLVQSPFELTIIHEFSHLLQFSHDPTYYDPAGIGSGLATFDMRGGAVDFQNQVAPYVFSADYVQASYQAQIYSTDARYSDVNQPKSWTYNNQIDDAAFGDNTAADSIDFSARTSDQRDLVFGFGGNDTILLGGGNDFGYGGNGADTVNGGDGDDVLFGEAGNDTINGGDGADFLAGGAGADVIDGGDGSDVISFLDRSSGITLTYSGNTLSGTVGEDSVASVESLITTNHADELTINATGLNNFFSTMGDDDVVNVTADAASEVTFIPVVMHLGDGEDTVNVAWDEFARTELILIGGDEEDKILFNGVGVEDVFAITNTEEWPGDYIHKIEYTDYSGEDRFTWDAEVYLETDSSRPGWVAVNFYKSDIVLVPDGEGELPVSSNEVIGKFMVFGFETGDYGVPDIASVGTANTEEVRSQLLEFTGGESWWWDVSSAPIHGALSSGALWDSMFLV